MRESVRGSSRTASRLWATRSSARRGPVGNLLASCANLETPLPAIDIVNECLEYLGTAPATVSGTVYDTSDDELAGYALCDDDDCKKKDRDCHDPVAIYAALPEYSTPATPVTKNQAVEPLVYNNLKTDFSSCDLPYSQALDVSRTYLQHFGSCRFEEMRTFRKCITEFALDPANPPVGLPVVSLALSGADRYGDRISGHYSGRVHHAFPGNRAASVRAADRRYAPAAAGATRRLRRSSDSRRSRSRESPTAA